MMLCKGWRRWSRKVFELAGSVIESVWTGWRARALPSAHYQVENSSGVDQRRLRGCRPVPPSTYDRMWRVSTRWHSSSSTVSSKVCMCNDHTQLSSRRARRVPKKEDLDTNNCLRIRANFHLPGRCGTERRWLSRGGVSFRLASELFAVCPLTKSQCCREDADCR